MWLTLDFGNSAIKAGVFSGGKLIHVETHRKFSKRAVDSLLKRFQIERGISSSVTESSIIAEKYLQKKILFTRLQPTSVLPIRNHYRTPKTLGMDRLANVIGARVFFSKKNVLVISAGTCITYDVINSNGDYFGGNITPGLEMRFKAMHTFTSRLPLVEKQFTDQLFGQSTESSMLTGVMKGTLFEMKNFISEYKKKYSPLKIVLTGGDLSFFESQFESKIFAVPHLVLHGLNEILRFNDLKKA